MSKDVIIDIKTKQYNDVACDTTELFTYGVLFTLDGENYMLSYRETDATGYDGNSVEMKINDRVVTMNRIGNAAGSLTIERGRKHFCHYGTPFGDFLTGIDGKEIVNDMDEDGGSLFLKYTVDINAGYMCQNELTINVRPLDNTVS